MSLLSLTRDVVLNYIICLLVTPISSQKQLIFLQRDVFELVMFGLTNQRILKLW